MKKFIITIFLAILFINPVDALADGVVEEEWLNRGKEKIIRGQGVMIGLNLPVVKV